MKQERQADLDSLQGSPPLHAGRGGYVMEDDPASPLGLVLHELHGVPPLLPALRLVVGSEAWESLVVTIEVRGLGVGGSAGVGVRISGVGGQWVGGPAGVAGGVFTMER